MKKYFLFSIFYFLFFIPPKAESAPYHSIAIDGNLADWADEERIVSDFSDGGVLDRIDAVYLAWDSDNLYIGINYKTDGGGMILYLDTDWEGQQGYNDLTQIDTWNKKAKFSAPGFLPDFMFGSWDSSDGNFYKITSSLTASGFSANSKTDFSGDIPGTEISVSWNNLFQVGFPAGLKVAVFAALCDGGALARDCAPDNITVSLPEADSCTVVNCDEDRNGVPDTRYDEGFTITSVNAQKIFSPNGDGINDNLSIKVSVNQPSDVYLNVYTIEGKKVWSGFSYRTSSGECTITWNGRNYSGQFPQNGIYILNLKAVNSSGVEARENAAVAVVK